MRRFVDTAVQTKLTAASAAGDATLTVESTAGWLAPAAGDVSVGAVDYGDPSKVDEFTYAGLTATSLTGVVGLGAAHSIGAKVAHVAAAADIEGGHRRHIPLLGTSGTLTNLAAAASEPFGPRIRTTVELGAGPTEWRAMCAISVAGSAGTLIRIQWSADEATWTTVVAPIAIDVTGRLKTAWGAIPAAALTGDIVFRLVAEGGDGVADPAIGSTHVEVR